MTTFTLPPGLAELGELRQFVTYKKEPKADGKLTKVPYQATADDRGRDVKASSTDSATWDTFEHVAAACAAGRFDGPGFVFSADDPYFFIDIDGCRNPETKQLTTIARGAVALANTYAEPSPSGTGIHIIGRGSLPQNVLGAGRQGKKRGAFEAYQGARFGTMTLQPIGSFNQINDVDDDIMVRLCAMFWPEDTTPKVAQPVAPQAITPTDWDDTALLEHAFAAKNGEDFRRQHNGVAILPNPSDDDFSYLGHLYFWCQGDPHRMRRIAHASARVRDKWDSRRGDGDWLDYSIANIIKQGGAVYQGTYHTKPAEGTGGYVATECARCAQLATDVQRLGDQVRGLQAENARLVARNADLEEENRTRKETADYPDQTVGGGVWDIAHALKKRFDRGEVLTENGKDYAPVICKQDAATRSATTIGRASDRIRTGGRLDTIVRPMKIETDAVELKVDIHHFHVPQEARRSVAAIVRHLLPPAPEKKQHGGARPRIAIPQPQDGREYPAAPVRRVTETWEKFFCTVENQLLGSERVGKPQTDFFTSDGEPITFAEVERLQDEAGYAPPRRPAYMKQDRQAGLQVAYQVVNDTGLQDEAAPPEPEPLHGRCAYCHRPRLGADAPYCGYHSPQGDAYRAASAQRGYAQQVGD